MSLQYLLSSRIQGMNEFQKIVGVATGKDL